MMSLVVRQCQVMPIRPSFARQAGRGDVCVEKLADLSLFRCNSLAGLEIPSPPRLADLGVLGGLETRAPGNQCCRIMHGYLAAPARSAASAPAASPQRVPADPPAGAALPGEPCSPA